MSIFVLYLPAILKLMPVSRLSYSHSFPKLAGFFCIISIFTGNS